MADGLPTAPAFVDAASIADMAVPDDMLWSQLLNLLAPAEAAPEYPTVDENMPQPASSMDCDAEFKAMVVSVWTNGLMIPAPPSIEAMTKIGRRLLSATFFRCIHPFTPFLHKPVFVVKHVRPDGPPGLHARMIFAFGARVIANKCHFPADQVQWLTLSKQLYESVRNSLSEIMVTPSVEAVQTLALLSIFEMGFGVLNHPYMYLGLSIRLAQTISLDKPLEDIPLSLLTYEQRVEREIRKRTWGAIAISETLLSIGSFRPIGLSKSSNPFLGMEAQPIPHATEPPFNNPSLNRLTWTTTTCSAWNHVLRLAWLMYRFQVRQEELFAAFGFDVESMIASQPMVASACIGIFQAVAFESIRTELELWWCEYRIFWANFLAMPIDQTDSGWAADPTHDSANTQGSQYTPSFAPTTSPYSVNGTGTAVNGAGTAVNGTDFYPQPSLQPSPSLSSSSSSSSPSSSANPTGAIHPYEHLEAFRLGVYTQICYHSFICLAHRLNAMRWCTSMPQGVPAKILQLEATELRTTSKFDSFLFIQDSAAKVYEILVKHTRPQLTSPYFSALAFGVGLVFLCNVFGTNERLARDAALIYLPVVSAKLEEVEQTLFHGPFYARCFRDLSATARAFIEQFYGPDPDATAAATFSTPSTETPAEILQRADEVRCLLFLPSRHFKVFHMKRAMQ
ncbi:hypothetical protein HK105_207176 [Polyrhizophydium stewartii]|uniref:Xylanolytic transcriptional activator regulatory domain-containing protein n=1 Tax=Polyrhizophydium stewartii TaxID=2732419 RepID=A0ABR4N189_9FUNG